MKSLRSLILTLVVGVSTALVAPAYAQQEVDPDHFDYAAQKATAQKAHSGHKMSPSNRHQHSRATMASRHRSRAHHRHTRAAA